MAKKPKKVKDKTKLKAWLKTKGHGAAKVNALTLDTDADQRKALFEIHGLKP
jgi:hypothetical protein